MNRLGIALAALLGVFLAVELLMAAGAVAARLAALALVAVVVGLLWIRERHGSR